MFEGLDQAQLSGAIEAMLFVTDEPVGVIELADMLEVDPKLVEQALVDLREKLEREQRGIQLREVAGPPITTWWRSTCCRGIRASFRRQPWKRLPLWPTCSLARAPALPACAA